MRQSTPIARRESFVLTSKEKRTISFVLTMFLLGTVTAHYRAAHSVPPSKIAINETAATTARPAQKRAEARRPKPLVQLLPWQLDGLSPEELVEQRYAKSRAMGNFFL